MKNAWEDLMEETNGEIPEAVVIGNDWEPQKPLGANDAQKLMEKMPGCSTEDRTNEALPIVAWTKTKVIFVSCYDGYTWMQSVPRNPQQWTPCFAGGM
jgi:hypothetical protein